MIDLNLSCLRFVLTCVTDKVVCVQQPCVNSISSFAPREKGRDSKSFSDWESPGCMIIYSRPVRR